MISLTLNYTNLQSTMVRLRRRYHCNSSYKSVTFTIHYGEIKTTTASPSSALWSNLQSTMVRLRQCLVRSPTALDFYLQSTMVRLRLDAAAIRRYCLIAFTIHYGEIKTRRIERYATDFVIYNPLW